MDDVTRKVLEDVLDNQKRYQASLIERREDLLTQQIELNTKIDKVNDEIFKISKDLEIQ